MKKHNEIPLKNQILMAFFASLGISIKPIISPIINMITDPLHITGGSTAGGIYMMILVMSGLLIREKYTCTMVGFLQGVLALILGITGFHGIWALLIYTVPGVVADICLSLSTERAYKIIIATVSANLTGSLITNLLFFKLPLIPFFLMVMMGILSATCGGIGANVLVKRLEKAIYEREFEYEK